MNGLFISTIKTNRTVEKRTSQELASLKESQKEFDANLTKERSKLNKSIREKVEANQSTHTATLDNIKLKSIITQLQKGTPPSKV